MRFLPYLVLLGAVIATLIWAGQRRIERKPPMLVGTAPADLIGQAVMVYGAERGPGRLHVTPTQLVFASGAGRVLVIERADITGVTLSRETPEGSTAAELLVVTTDHDVACFLVDEPQRWAARLL